MEKSATYPKGIPYIIGNEAAERFSYYGMKTILVVFMTTALMNRQGQPAFMNETEATAWYHVFGMANYFFPIFGALLSDIFWGKYKTIIILSLVYCAGHACLAIDDTRLGLALGLTLIAMGSGGIKPCVSAHVGDQFSKQNVGLLSQTFGYFYIAINVGAAIPSLATPYLLEHYGPSVAFAVPGVLMLLATWVFWLGRNTFIAIPPVGFGVYSKELLSPAGRTALKKLSIVFLFVSIFWSLFDQTGSSWVFQAEHMDKKVNVFGLFQFELLASQIQAINPILILLLIPLFQQLIFPFLRKRFTYSALGLIASGLIVAGLAFVICAYAESKIQAGQSISIAWQALAYLVLTISEVMVSVTTLEYAYTQSPPALKSLSSSFYLLAVSLGNGVTAATNFLIEKDDGTTILQGASYYLFFAGLIGVSAVLLKLWASKFDEVCYVQGEGV